MRNFLINTIAGLAVLAANRMCLAEDTAPPLPAGLGGLAAESSESTPALPSGLPGSSSTDDTEPVLPSGLDNLPGSTNIEAEQAADKKNWLDFLNDSGFSGFAEIAAGVRTQPDRQEDDLSLAEARLRIEWQRTFDAITMRFSGDVVYDSIVSNHEQVNLVTGHGIFDLREAWLSFRPTSFMDVKLGRQSLTWGTGDLLFVNDMFAKDWQSFFIGRDLEYLKAPTDAARISFYSNLANAEVVYMPRFVPSRYINGDRLSFYNPLSGKLAGHHGQIDNDRPSKWIDSQQWAMRAYRKLGSYELAAYSFIGYWSTPEGMDFTRISPFTFYVNTRYPKLNSYGSSLRGPLAGGIANIEAAFYQSREDTNGDDPLTRNSEIRLLAGYETDLPSVAPDLTVGVQYYLEHMCDYSAYRRNMLAGSPSADRMRHVFTGRITKLAMNQNLNLGLFGYFSPSDQDTYIRPSVSYKISDHLTWTLGANIFAGEHEHTFFGQFRKNTNVYTTLRLH